MKKRTGILMALALSPIVNAADNQPDILLDKITFQLSAKQWVTTKTALLTANINATLSNADLVKARADIMGRLAKIAKGEWHITDFQRSQDSSGLEKLFVNAQARVEQEHLTTIYENAKAVSQPGAKYTIANVEFKPSLEETQAVRSQIRNNLYKQVTSELQTINQNYPDQKYSLSNLVFLEGEQPSSFQAREMKTMALTAAAPSLLVSNELLITALVEAASNRPKGG